MLPESQIQNCKKIFLDEVRRKAEKAFDEESEKLEMPPEIVAFLKDNFVNDQVLSHEENFKTGIRLAKEFCRIEQKQH